jgi:DNA polymerase III alpha subunit (gram-positive type)
MKIAIVDIESTGFSHEKDCIVEIGIVIADTVTREKEIVFNKVVKEAHFNSSNKRHQDAWIFSNSDLTIDEVDNADSLETYREEIQEIFNKHKATAFNKKFDFEYLISRGFNIKQLDCLMLKSMNHTKLPGKYASQYKWPTVMEAYAHFFPNTNYDELHRGADDAFHEADIMFALVDIKSSNDA